MPFAGDNELTSFNMTVKYLQPAPVAYSNHAARLKLTSQIDRNGNRDAALNFSLESASYRCLRVTSSAIRDSRFVIVNKSIQSYKKIDQIYDTHFFNLKQQDS